MREDGRRSFYDKVPRQIQVSLILGDAELERVDALKIGAERRSAVLRHIIDIALPIAEKRKLAEEKPER